jgi:putative copper export protein
LLAANNRYRLTPDLEATLNEPANEPGNARVALSALLRSVGLETALAVVLLATVSVLGTLPPPMGS